MYIRIADAYLKGEQSFFLFGPRATGKTTWIKSSFPKAVFIDLLDSAIYTKLLAAPERLEGFIPPGYKGKIVIDEIQKVPALLNEVHRLIERKGYSFVLTGSSARALRKKGVNLLAGRALTRFFHPLTVRELGKDFHLENSLNFGHLPYVFRAGDKKAYLASYISTYLREEILQEGLTRSIASFSKFLEVASFSQGGIINATEIARETGIERKTVEAYFQIVEDLLIGTRLPAFNKRAKRRLVLGEKFFFFDTGVYRAIRPVGPLDAPEEISGALLQTLLLQEFAALNDYYGLGYTPYYWRTSNKTEVDFVFYGEKGFIAVEVKRGKATDASKMSGLKLFQKDYPQAKCYFVCGADRREYHEKIEIWPLKDFIVQLPEILKGQSKSHKKTPAS